MKDDEALARIRKLKNEELLKLSKLASCSHDEQNEPDILQTMQEEASKKEAASLKRAKTVNTVIKAAKDTSLGISIVVAIILGVLIGLYLRYLTGELWTLFIGVFIGLAAAVLNVYKAYKQLQDLYKDEK